MNRLTLSVALAAATVTGACREAAMSPDLAPTAAVQPSAIGTSPSSTIFERTFSMPVNAITRIALASCDVRNGPGIKLDTRLQLGGLSTQVEVENTTGTPDEAVATFQVLSTGADVTLPPRSDRAGLGGDPFVWVQFEDNTGQALSAELPLGACSQLVSPQELVVDYSELVQATTAISVTQCGTEFGPMVSVAGQLALENGLFAQVILRDDQPPAGTPAEVGADAVRRIQLYSPGLDVKFQKQSLRAEVGGDPSITATYLDAQGTVIGVPETLGTCEELS
jgi:hypothetical protein